jgi:hypothetical protein
MKTFRSELSVVVSKSSMRVVGLGRSGVVGGAEAFGSASSRGRP